MSSRPQPVLNAVTFKTVLQSAVYVLGFLGANDAANWVTGHTAVLVSVGIVLVNAGGDLLAAIHAAGKVTPLDDPKAVDGTALVPVTALVAPAVSASGGLVDVEPMAD